jgi:hypothetical protein
VKVSWRCGCGVEAYNATEIGALLLVIAGLAEAQDDIGETAIAVRTTGRGDHSTVVDDRDKGFMLMESVRSLEAKNVI